MHSIRELEAITWLDEIAADYQRQCGASPFNLSHWDPSPETVRALVGSLRLPVSSDELSYLYSYELPILPNILQRIGFETEQRACLVVPNGTTAILFAATWLKSLSIERVLVLCPSYFPVFYACDLAHIECVRVYMDRTGRQWRLPTNAITDRLGPRTAVWITNPVYCTGAYLSQRDGQFVDSLLSDGVATVVDECLALNGREIGPCLSSDAASFLGLYSPHKAVCMNAVKFAALVFNSCYERFFSEWVDVLSGGLGASSHVAALHFIGNNFRDFQVSFLSHIARIRDEVQKVVGAHKALELDSASEGYFLSCYAPSVDAQADEGFVRALAFGTGALVIPGSRNHFPPQAGFNFRINLARAGPQFSSALRRTAAYLNTPIIS